jgi:hypothetical protein
MHAAPRLPTAVFGIVLIVGGITPATDFRGFSDVTLSSSGSHPAGGGVETFVETGSADSPCILCFPNIQPVYQCRQTAVTAEDRHF